METEIVSVKDVQDPASVAILSRAGELLREGRLVVFPTETVYGLGACALDATAAERIYRAKGRPSDNPLIVHVAEPCEADRFAVTSPLFYRLARHFMPGPLTVIMPVRENVPKTVTAGLSTVAIRCPAHPVAHALLTAAGIPVAAPSANLSGSPSPTDAPHVCDDMCGRVDMIIDGGDCEYGLESTIVKIEDENTLLLLRPGAVTAEDLRALGVEVKIAPAVLEALREGETVLSPGLKYRHYAPKAPLFLLTGDEQARHEFLTSQTGRVAYLGYEEELDALGSLSIALYSLGAERDVAEQARRLFRLLRDVDKENYDRIYAPTPVTSGVGMALYNRMIRAAAHQKIVL